jgi:hypothetical protein
VLWISWETIHASLQQALRGQRQQTEAQSESVARAADLLSDLDALMRMRQIQPFTGWARAVTKPPVGRAPGQAVFLASPADSRKTWAPIGTCCPTWRLDSDRTRTKSPLRSGLAINRRGQ